MNQSAEVTPMENSNGEFSHRGITVEEGYKIAFSHEAEEELKKVIKKVKDTIGVPSEIIATTNITTQAVADVLIEEGKKGKVQKFLERFIKNQSGGLGEKGTKKLTHTTQKYTPEKFFHIEILYTDETGKKITYPVPLIIRKNTSYKDAIHSLRERAGLSRAIQSGKRK